MSAGKAKFDKLAALLPRLRERGNAGAALEALIKAALADEEGHALDKAIADLAAAISWRRIGLSASETHRRLA